MTGTYIKCPSCAKANVPDARYCISCGSILAPVYCSSCGTANPEGLEQCLECGNFIPKLSGIRWTPIVTVLQPTSAMGDEDQSILDIEVEPETTDQSEPRGVWSRLRGKFKN